MNKLNKIVKAKIKDATELKRVEASKNEAYYLSEDKGSFCSEIEVSHFKDVAELSKNLNEEHLKSVNLQITIKAMDAERTKLEAILRDKPQSINSLIKASGLTPAEIAAKLGLSI